MEWYLNQFWEVGFIGPAISRWDRRRGRELMAHPAWSLIAMMMSWPVLTRRFEIDVKGTTWRDFDERRTQQQQRVAKFHVDRIASGVGWCWTNRTDARCGCTCCFWFQMSNVYVALTNEQQQAAGNRQQLIEINLWPPGTRWWWCAGFLLHCCAFDEISTVTGCINLPRK